MSRKISTLTFAICLLGCGGWNVANARRALELTAEGVQETDNLTAPLHREAVDRANASAEAGGTAEEFDEILEPWRTLTTAINQARAWLRVAEAAVDAWAAGESADDWKATIPCVLVGLRELSDAVSEVVPNLPDELMQAIDYAAARSSAACARSLPAEATP